MTMEWTLQTWGATGLSVGPAAWRVTMLAGEYAEHVRQRPSLVVVSPEDSEAVLAAAAPRLGELPVMLGVAEPTFARRLPELIEARMAALGRSRVEVLTLHVDDPSELKSGGMLQTMFKLREQGRVAHLGLAHPDALAVEWLAANAAVRVLGVAYSLEEQMARYRAMANATAYGMVSIALSPPQSVEELRFALAERARVLPMLDAPLPADLEPMDAAEVEATWAAYQQTHAEPPPLPRSRPPE